VTNNTGSRGYPSPSDITLGSDPAFTKENNETVRLFTKDL
jgi:hypothetical protein